jgi:DNA primase
MSAGLSGGEWIEAVRAQVTVVEAGAMVSELGVEGIKVDDDERLPRYIGGVLARLQEVSVGRQIAEMKSKLQRMSPVEQSDDYNTLFGDLIALETYRKSLLQQASGDDLTA